MPNRYAVGFCACIIAVTTSCTWDLGPQPDLPPAVPSFLHDLSVSGPYASVLLGYGPDAPPGRVKSAFMAGVRDINDSPEHLQVWLTVSMAALHNLLPRLEALRWIVSIEVDSSVAGTASSRVP
jgi:hypothetical protein